MAPISSTETDVRGAVLEGLATGARRHLPGTVGLVVKGIPLCAGAAYAHLALGVSVPDSTVGSTVLATVAGLGGAIKATGPLGSLRARGHQQRTDVSATPTCPVGEFGYGDLDWFIGSDRVANDRQPRDVTCIPGELAPA